MEFYIHHHKIWLYREGKRDCPKSRFCLITAAKLRCRICWSFCLRICTLLGISSCSVMTFVQALKIHDAHKILRSSPPYHLENQKDGLNKISNPRKTFKWLSWSFQECKNDCSFGISKRFPRGVALTCEPSHIRIQSAH